MSRIPTPEQAAAAVSNGHRDAEPAELRDRILALLDSDKYGLYLRDVVEHCGQAARDELDALLSDGLVILRDRRWFRAPPAAEPVTLAPVPAYPVEAMPDPLGAFIRWAVADGLVPAFAAGAGLAVLAAMCGNAELRVGSAVFRPSLWLPLTGPPSLAKGATVNHAFEELSALHSGALERWEENYERWQQDRDACGNDKKALQALGLPPARPRNLRTSIATIEAIARACLASSRDSRGYATAIAPDELGGFLDSLGRYGNSRGAADRAWLREMWTGSPVQIFRVGDGGIENAVDIFLPRPVVVICGPLLPEDTGNLGNDAKGDRARWLMHYAPPGFRVRLRERAEPKPDVWAQAIRKLYAVRDRRTWQLHGEVFRLWERASSRWQAMEDEPWPEHVIQFLRKANHHAAAVALVLAEAQQAMGAAAHAAGHSGEWIPWTGGDIPAEAMRGAIAEVDYALGCWKAVDSGQVLMLSPQARELTTGEAKLLAWLDKRKCGNEGLPPGTVPRPRATRRDIQAAQVGGAIKPDLVDALIAEHKSRFPGCVVSVDPPGGGLPTVYVYAPERGSGETPNGVGPTPSEDIHTDSPPEVTPGHESANRPDERCWVPNTVHTQHRPPNTVEQAETDTADTGESQATEAIGPAGNPTRRVRCPACGWADPTAVPPGGKVTCHRCATTFTG